MRKKTMLFRIFYVTEILKASYLVKNILKKVISINQRKFLDYLCIQPRTATSITALKCSMKQILNALFQALNEKAKSITGIHQWPYRAVSRALEVVPKTLIQNCGASTIRTLTALRVGTQSKTK